ncbi:hypothetical protein CCUS01_02779 [Colletotrichum cuscutae]|uniref:Uncharacterized protein n=1 Tax=Colletotrichum cuscutae TaxID=1209917 RepID=A0AAI9YC49_9PEZI|nr:hypothetical protein CCUS01_02779 [Colletotrichum cuscutae]
MGESGNSLIASCSLAPGPRKRSRLAPPPSSNSAPFPCLRVRVDQPVQGTRFGWLVSHPLRFGLARRSSPHTCSVPSSHSFNHVHNNLRAILFGGNHHQSSLSFSRKIPIVLLNTVSSFVFPFVAGLLISASSRVSLVSGFHPLRLSPCVKCYCTVVSFRKNVCSLCVGIGKPPPRRRP